MSEPRYDVPALTRFVEDVFLAAGLAAVQARPVARALVTADCLGHDTHGLALAPWYLGHIEDGTVPRSGTPEIVSDRGAAVCWDGKRLIGAYLVEAAMDLAIDRAQTHGTCTVAVGNAHHIGALAVYLERATQLGMMASISSSSPSGAQVAPFGGLTGIYNPQPIAFGIPTGDNTILIDISAAMTTANMAKRLATEGRSYAWPCLMDAQGQPSTDPSVLDAGGTILPVGGRDHGQKGYGLSLTIEAMTQGLAGYGRADAPSGTNSAFTVQVHDPEAFGGRGSFLKQTGWLASACLASTPHPDSAAVRLPGQAAQQRRAEAKAHGLTLYPGIMKALSARAEAFGVTPPAPLA